MTSFVFTPLAELDAVARGAKGADRLSLARIDGAPIPGGTLRVLLGPKSVGKRYFRLQRDDGARQERFVEALYNDGPYPGHNWVEVYDLELPAPIRGREHFAAALEPYLRPVADAIPAGGHLMAEYEKPDWSTTQRGLLAGIPPIATPLGALLFSLGVGDSFKDWYFPEGGMEGSRKLQGNKAYTVDQRVEMHRQRAEELRQFLRSAARGPRNIERPAREIAAATLEGLAHEAASPEQADHLR
jgi:hypothetical protein